MTRRRVRALAALLPAAVTAALGASASAGSGGPEANLAAVRICTGSSPPKPAGLYRYVILQASESRRIAEIKKRSPGTQVLAYKDMASTRDNAGSGSDLPTGVSYAYANRHHPEWFLRDTQGRRVSWASWPHSWQMDVGSRSYQRAWARGVARDLRLRGWDGVFVDGISRTMQYPWYLNGRTLAKYPGPDDYARATTRFLRRVGPALRRRYLVVGNVNDAWPPLWGRWLGSLSGVSKEWWTKSSVNRGAGMLTGADWSNQTNLLREAQARHKIFIAIAYGQPDDVAAMNYARASFLLFARGTRSALSYSPWCAPEPSAPNWRADVGTPAGTATQVGAVWRRDFANGVVVVNPTSSSTVTVPLSGSYVGPNGSAVTSVVAPPHTGFVLRRA